MCVATQYRIQAVPTLLFFKQGQVVDQVVGVVPKQVLVDKLNALFESDATLDSSLSFRLPSPLHLNRASERFAALALIWDALMIPLTLPVEALECPSPETNSVV